MDALAAFGGFAAVVVGLVVGFAMRPEEEQDHDTYLRGEWGQISNPITYAAGRGDLRMLLQLTETKAYRGAELRGMWSVPARWASVAARRVDCSRFLTRDYEVYSRLAEQGNLGLLRWTTSIPTISAVGTPVIALTAARCGQLSVLRWAHAHWPVGRPEEALSVCVEAAKGGHLPILRWARARGLGPNEEQAYQVAQAAAEWGHTGVLQWLDAEGFVLRTLGVRVCEAAARGGQLATLQWLRAEGCPWCDATTEAAVEHGHLESLRWAYEQGCPLDKEHTCHLAAYEGHLGVLQWARSVGCHWGPNVCKIAAEQGHLAVLQWLRAEGCPWDSDTSTAAADGEHLEVLEWALQAGCPPPPSCNQISRSYDVDWLPFMRAVHLHGCAQFADEPDVCLANLRALAAGFVYRRVACRDGFRWGRGDLFHDGLALPATAAEWGALEAALVAYATTYVP